MIFQYLLIELDIEKDVLGSPTMIIDLSSSFNFVSFVIILSTIQNS